MSPYWMDLRRRVQYSSQIRYLSHPFHVNQTHCLTQVRFSKYPLQNLTPLEFAHSNYSNKTLHVPLLPFAPYRFLYYLTKLYYASLSFEEGISSLCNSFSANRCTRIIVRICRVLILFLFSPLFSSLLEMAAKHPLTLDSLRAYFHSFTELKGELPEDEFKQLLNSFEDDPRDRAPLIKQLKEQNYFKQGIYSIRLLFYPIQFNSLISFSSVFHYTPHCLYDCIPYITTNTGN